MFRVLRFSTWGRDRGVPILVFGVIFWDLEFREKLWNPEIGVFITQFRPY